MDSYWSFWDFQQGKPRWTTSNGNPVMVVPGEQDGFEAVFLVIEVYASGEAAPFEDWLGHVRYLYASISDPEDALEYIIDDDALLEHIIAQGGNDFMRWALF